MNYFTTALIFVVGISFSPVFASDDHVERTHITTPEIVWELSPFGPEIWKVDGDLLEGKHITYIKFPAGTVTPLHIHSADYVGIVVTGTTRHWSPKESDTYKMLPPGSHWKIFANKEHVSECLPGVECVMAIYQDQAFDFIPLGDAPKPPKDK